MSKIYNKNTDSTGKKEWCKEYYGSKEFDHSCRNHGSCPWCQSNRQYGDYKRQLTAKEELDLIHDPEEYDTD